MVACTRAMELEQSFLVHIPGLGARLLAFTGKFNVRCYVSLTKIVVPGPSADGALDGQRGEKQTPAVTQLGTVDGVARAVVDNRQALRVEFVHEFAGLDSSRNSTVTLVPRYHSDVDRILLLLLASQQFANDSGNSEADKLRGEMIKLAHGKLFPKEFGLMDISECFDSDSPDAHGKAAADVELDHGGSENGLVLELGNLQLCLAQRAGPRLVMDAKPVPYAEIIRLHMPSPQMVLMQLRNGRVLSFGSPKLDMVGVVMCVLGRVTLYA